MRGKLWFNYQIYANGPSLIGLGVGVSRIVLSLWIFFRLLEQLCSCLCLFVSLFFLFTTVNSLYFSCYSFINNIFFLLIKKKKLFRLGFHQVKLQRNIHYILSMMTGCGSLKRGTHTEKTMVLGTGMLGTWLHSCLCNVRQKKNNFLFHTQLQHKDNYYFQKTKKNFDYWAQLGLSIDPSLDSLSICYICCSIDHSELSCLKSILRLAAAQTSSVIFLCVFVCLSPAQKLISVSIFCFLLTFEFWVFSLIFTLYFLLSSFCNFIIKIINSFPKEKETYQNVFSFITLM